MAKVPFIPFEKVKAEVSIEQAMSLVGLPFKKDGHSLRCECPVHGGGDRTLVVTPTKNHESGSRGVYKCHASDEKGGDTIGLIAHVRSSKPYAAMLELCERFAPHLLDGRELSHKSAPPPVTEPEEKEKTRGGERAFYLPQYAQHDHEAVREAMGVPTELAQSLGISYWTRGYHGGRVALLLRHPDGRNAGCISLPVALVRELKLPPKWS